MFSSATLSYFLLLIMSKASCGGQPPFLRFSSRPLSVDGKCRRHGRPFHSSCACRRLAARKRRSELVHTDRLLQMVSKRNERNKVAGLPDCSDFMASDGADRLCPVAHDGSFDGCLCEMLIVSTRECKVWVRSWSMWLFLLADV